MGFYPKSKYKKGSFNYICDVTGFKFKGNTRRKNWLGNVVHKKHWEGTPEAEHPLRHRREQIPVPDARPRPTGTFIQNAYEWALMVDTWTAYTEVWGDYD